MIQFQIKNHELEDQFLDILNQHYKGDIEKLLEEFIQLESQKEIQRKKNKTLLQYKGILSDSSIDGLAFQKKVREEWS